MENTEHGSGSRGGVETQGFLTVGGVAAPIRPPSHPFPRVAICVVRTLGVSVLQVARSATWDYDLWEG
jgi:hypothetical protein